MIGKEVVAGRKWTKFAAVGRGIPHNDDDDDVGDNDDDEEENK